MENSLPRIDPADFCGFLPDLHARGRRMSAVGDLLETGRPAGSIAIKHSRSIYSGSLM
jgi:hypothetical protein